MAVVKSRRTVQKENLCGRRLFLLSCAIDESPPAVVQRGSRNGFRPFVASCLHPLLRFSCCVVSFLSLEPLNSRVVVRHLIPHSHELLPKFWIALQNYINL